MKINIKINKAIQLYSLWKVVRRFLPKKKKEVIVKKGIATSELWLTVAFDLLAIGFMVAGTLNPELMIKILGITNGIYLVSRTIVKLTATELDDAAVAKLKELIDKSK